MKLLKLILILSLTVATACSRDRAPGNPREYGPTGSENGPQSPQDLPELPNALQSGTLTACARIDSLGSAGNSAFSYWREIFTKGKGLNGGVDIAESPFVQLFFGEKFVVATPEEFLQIVEEEYKAGKVSELQYRAIQAAKLIPPLLRTLQFKATNDKLLAGFPGVFGEADDVTQSLHFLLAQKASFAKFDLNAHGAILTARLPQFTTAEWPQFTEDARLSLQSIIKSSATDPTTGEGVRERVCGLVLWQRAFAQLLMLKGYVQPEMFVNDSNSPYTRKLNKLSDKYPEYKKTLRAGAFYDPTMKKTVVLDANDIATYDPSKKTFFVGAHLPTLGVQSNQAGFTDELNLLEGLVYMYAATSPAAPWIKKGSDYVFGDIQDAKSNAIVPADAHSLALGLMRINLKNLAKYRIVKLNDKGSELKAGEKLAGFIPMADKATGVSLQNVIQLTRIAVTLDQALGYFKNGTPETWKQFHPQYDRKTLAMLTGSLLIPEDEVKKLLSPEEYESILNTTLTNFRLPIASLLVQMGGGEKCISHLDWNLKTGERKATGQCSANEAKDVKAALRLLALHIRSKFLYQKSLP